MTPVLLSWSGGKDSALALHALRQRDDVEVAGLLTTLTRGYDRVSMHGVRRELVQQQAESIGLPLIEAWIDPRASNADYESAFEDALAPSREAGIGTIAFGDLFLEDIRSYREALVLRLGLTALFPVWGVDTAALATTFIHAGFRARLCCVDTRVVPATFCGREFDVALLAELPSSVDPCGERGEFHTFVYDGPILEASVPVTTGIERQDGPFVFRDLVPMLTPEEMCR